MTTMLKGCHRARGSAGAESGQALIEMALFALLLLSLLIGSIDYGRFAYDGILLGNGARAGVQYGAQNLATANDATGMQNAATADAQNLGATATATNYCTCTDGITACNVKDDPPSCSPRLVYVQVTTTGSFAPWVKFPGVPANLPMSRTAVMQVSP